MQIPPSLPRLDIVIVTWNSGTCLTACLASLEAASRTGFTLDRVIVVDNASGQPFDLPSQTSLPLSVIRNPENRGFAAACTQGAEGTRADYLLFLNPDTRVEADALAVAVTTLESRSQQRTAIVGLPLVDERGERQPTCGRFLSVGSIFNQVTGLSALEPVRFPGFRMTEWDHRDTRNVDYVCGACLLVRRTVFEELGGFDPRFFVYLEDADLALRARRLGWDVLFLSQPVVYHRGGWGTGLARSFRLAHAWRSLMVYGVKHLGFTGSCRVTAIVVGLAPIARASRAVIDRSPRAVAQAFGGYARFWGLLAQDFLARRRRAVPQTADAPPASSSAAVTTTSH